MERPADAWRQLSSIIERHPGDGGAYAQVAGVLQGLGDLEQADGLWRRAALVEPTNPTWLLSRAQNLMASGDEATARQLVEKVARGEWQDRFANVTGQAKNLLEGWRKP